MRSAKLLRAFEEYVSNACLASLVAVLALQVLFRYVLNLGLSWSEEVSRFLFIWFVYLSARYAVERGTHIRVNLGVDLLPERFAKVARPLSDLVWIAFNLMVVVSGIVLIRIMIARPVYSTSLFVPLSIIYAVIPIAHALMVVRIVQTYIDGHGTWRESARPPS